MKRPNCDWILEKFPQPATDRHRYYVHSVGDCVVESGQQVRVRAPYVPAYFVHGDSRCRDAAPRGASGDAVEAGAVYGGSRDGGGGVGAVAHLVRGALVDCGVYFLQVEEPGADHFPECVKLQFRPSLSTLILCF